MFHDNLPRKEVIQPVENRGSFSTTHLGHFNVSRACFWPPSRPQMVTGLWNTNSAVYHKGELIFKRL